MANEASANAAMASAWGSAISGVAGVGGAALEAGDDYSRYVSSVGTAGNAMGRKAWRQKGRPGS